MTANEQANVALRGIIAHVAKSHVEGDNWDRAYFRGQISILKSYFEPDPALIEQAGKAVDALATRHPA